MTRQEPEPRKPGRPRKYGEGRHQSSVRFTPTRYAALKAEADKNARSISEEVEYRVERSFGDDTLLSIKRDLDQVSRDTGALMIEQLQRATARIQELEARIDKLQSENSLSEEAIERAIVRAFAKMGEVK